jgi:hypothetical protein
LGTGRHTFASLAVPATVVLRWGVNLYRPAEAPISNRLFRRFERLRD